MSRTSRTSRIGRISRCRRITRLGVLAALTLGASAACARAIPSGATPSYAEAQAVEGRREYEGACVACHTVDLAGDGSVPGLAGPAFAGRWNGRPVAELTGFLRGHMPRGNPGLLNDRTYLSLVSYMLQRNGVMAGAAPLTFESTWPIRIGPR